MSRFFFWNSITQVFCKGYHLRTFRACNPVLSPFRPSDLRLFQPPFWAFLRFPSKWACIYFLGVPLGSVFGRETAEPTPFWGGPPCGPGLQGRPAALRSVHHLSTSQITSALRIRGRPQTNQDHRSCLFTTKGTAILKRYHEQMEKGLKWHHLDSFFREQPPFPQGVSPFALQECRPFIDQPLVQESNPSDLSRTHQRSHLKGSIGPRNQHSSMFGSKQCSQVSARPRSPCFPFETLERATNFKLLTQR